MTKEERDAEELRDRFVWGPEDVEDANEEDEADDEEDEISRDGDEKPPETDPASGVYDGDGEPAQGQ